MGCNELSMLGLRSSPSDSDASRLANLLSHSWQAFRTRRQQKALEARGICWLHGLFDDNFLRELCDRMWETPGETASQNMYACRHFLRDSVLAERIFQRIPSHEARKLGLSGVCSEVRFIRYPLGGFIAPHLDGTRMDPETGLQTHVSFLLYLSTVPEGEGGETTFLTALPGDGGDGVEPSVVFSCRPVEGSILLFPHETPHQGEAVGRFPKVLLRGDLY